MKKKNILLIGSFLISAIIFAGEKEDLNFIDQIYKQQNYEMALSEGKRFLIRYPNSKNSKLVEERLAKTYYIRKNYSEAIKVFSNIIEKYQLTQEEKDEICYYISKIYLIEENEVEWSKYVNIISGNTIYKERAVYDAGVIYLERNDYENAFKAFKNVAVTGKELRNPATFNMALTAYNDENYTMVIEILNRYVPLKDKNRDQSAIDYLYGTSYYKMDNIPKSIFYFEKLVKENLNSPYGKKAAVTLIEIYANAGNSDMVNKTAQLIKGSSEEKEASVILGDFYTSKENYSKSKTYYLETGLQTNPRAMYGYAYSLYREGNFKEALPYFQKLEKTSYYNQAIYYKFAIYYKLNDYSRILKERDSAKKIVVTQQDNDNINIIIANSAYELEDFVLARDYYSRLNLHTPSKDNLFRVITMSGKLNAAKDVEQRITDYKKLYPGDKEYRKKIYIAAGESLYNNGKASEAERLYREYLMTDKDSDVLKALTAILVNEKKYGEMTGILDQQEDNAENRYLRAVSATGTGNYAEAESDYARVLSMIANNPQNELYQKAKANRIKNYFLMGDYSKAVSEGESYLENPNALDKKDITEKVGLSYFRLENTIKSREYFEKLLNTEKGDSANLQIAETYLIEKNYARARKIYEDIYRDGTNEKDKEIALYSMAKVASDSKNTAEFKKISNEFLNKYPESSYKENLLSNFSSVAENLKSNSDIVSSYKTIYNNTEETYLKESSAEKIAEASLKNKNYSEAEKFAKELGDKTKKSYLLARIYLQKGANNNAKVELENLLKNPGYKEYALVNLSKYHYERKEYSKATQYYKGILNMTSSYKDLATFQLADIDEKSKRTDSAIKGYINVFKNFKKSQYAEEAKVKAAALYEMKNMNEAAKLYVDISKTSKNKNYKVFAYEKLVYLNLKGNQEKTAEQYYKELKKLDASTAKKYEDFFKGGA
ncbi:MAG: tetratricopeptide repeat protein [Fusobacteriaceae bacterium]